MYVAINVFLKLLLVAQLALAFFVTMNPYLLHLMYVYVPIAGLSALIIILSKVNYFNFVRDLKKDKDKLMLLRNKFLSLIHFIIWGAIIYLFYVNSSYIYSFFATVYLLFCLAITFDEKLI